MIDWEDIILHVIAALAATMLMMVLLIWSDALTVGTALAAAAANAAFWVAREIIQDINKGHVWPVIWPIRRSTQKDWEAAAPALAGLTVAGVSVMVT